MATTVKELIDLLSTYDPDASVRIVDQPNYPFEYSVSGVVSREEVLDLEDEEETDSFEDDPEVLEEHRACKYENDPDRDLDDVFLVTGNQICYGSKTIWEVI